MEKTSNSSPDVIKFAEMSIALILAAAATWLLSRKIVRAPIPLRQEHSNMNKNDTGIITLATHTKELLRRAEKTTKARYSASDRLERHHKFSQWTVSLISTALVFVPMMQAFDVDLGAKAIYLNATQAVLAVLVLVYSLLLGQENFISRSEAMQRNALELGAFSRHLAGSITTISQEEYKSYVNAYYDILQKYPNHKPIDYLYTQLADTPKGTYEQVRYCYRWIRVRVITCLIFSHYFIAMGFVLLVLHSLFKAMAESGS